MAALFLSFVLARTLGSQYDLQLSALLFAIYVIVKRFFPKSSASSGEEHGQNISTHIVLDSVLFTMIIMNIVLTSGGLQSPVFFLVYFLLFALSLMLEPIVSLTTTLTIVALFVPDVPVDFTYTQLLPLISLPFLVPFAVFLGSAYRTGEEQSEKLRTTEQDALLFISTIVREHVRMISEAEENKDDKKVRSSAKRLEKLIDTFEEGYP